MPLLQTVRTVIAAGGMTQIDPPCPGTVVYTQALPDAIVSGLDEGVAVTVSTLSFVEAAAESPGVLRLDPRLADGAFAHPSDQRDFRFVITNNDPDQTFPASSRR